MYTFILLLVALVWGSTFFIIKETVSDVNEYFIVFGRTLIAAVVMTIVSLIRDKKSFLNRDAIIKGSILGLLLALTYIPQTIGLKYTSSGHSAFITGAAVALVPLLLFLFYRESINKMDILSVVIVVFGLYLLTYNADTKINIGDLITLITMIAYALNIVLAGRYVKNSDVFTMVTFQFITASIISGLIYVFSDTPALELSSKSIWAILYLGFIGTLFCYFVTIWVQQFVSTLRLAIILSLEPIFASWLAYAIVNEILTQKEIIGAFVILAGVTTYQLSETYKSNKLKLKSKTFSE